MSYNYNPQPARVWSRVQHSCSFINNNNNNNNNNLLSIQKEGQMMLKGNILQYKKNSSNLTKNQRYSKIAKGQWTNRTKTWATQSQTYTNPNVGNLLRVNYYEIPVPFNAVLPLDCSSNVIKDGGSLICNKFVDPCTNNVIKTTHSSNCSLTSSSDVPGPIQELCWNDRIQTWYPRQNLTMNNSSNKWPEGYKKLTSAVSPGAPYLMVDVSGNIATLSWKIIFNTCLPVNSFNIYENGQFIKNVLYPNTSYNVSISSGNNSFYVTSLSGVNESGPSNIVNVYKEPSFILTGGGSYIYNSSNGVYNVTFNSSGTIQFFDQDTSTSPITGFLVGGGGGGGGGSNTYNTTIKGGGGGGGAQTNYFSTNSYTNNVIYNINIGTGGPGGLPLGGTGGSGGNGNQSSVTFNTTYIALGGEGGQASQGGDGGGGPGNGGAVSEPPSYSNGGGGGGVNSGNLYGGGGGGGGANGSGSAPSMSGNVAGGGGGGVAYNITSGLISTAGGGGGGGTSGSTGYAGGIGGSLYGGLGAKSDGSVGANGNYGAGGGGGSGAQNDTDFPYYGAQHGGKGGNGLCILQFTLTSPLV